MDRVRTMTFMGRPRVRLLEVPTPLQRLSRIEAQTGHRGIYVKRDDAMPLGLGGNKLRSLEFWLGEALAEKCDVLLVAGRAVSNQCRLTAAAAAQCGLDCVVIHNDDPPTEPTGNLLLSQLYGADIRFVGPMDEEARAREVLATREALAAEGRRPYVVGDPVVGALGYVAGALELHEQAFACGIGLRHVVLPGSMGVTEAGFLYGCALIGRPFKVHLITVEYEVAELEHRVQTVLREIAGATGMEIVGNPKDFVCYYDAYLGEGYDRPTPESLEAIRRFAAEEALLLEITYTSKTFAGLLSLITERALPRDEPVCVIHTGGVPSLFQQSAQLSQK